MSDEIDQIRLLIEAMYNDHCKYPQLRLPDMQADRLMNLMSLRKALPLRSRQPIGCPSQRFPLLRRRHEKRGPRNLSPVQTERVPAAFGR